MNAFEDLSAIDVTDHIKAKGGFNYLSWPYALSTLLKKFPESTWFAHEFPHYLSDEQIINVPYLKTDLGYFVKTSVTIGDITRTQLHPVLNYKNDPIEKPTTFEINSAIQRCLVKTIALHGLGLYIYAGEDLPIDAPPFTEEQQDIFYTLLEDNDSLGMFSFLHDLPDETYKGLFSSFPKGKKTESKEKIREMERKAHALLDDYAHNITVALDNNDNASLTENLNEIGNDPVIKKAISDRLDAEHYTALKDFTGK